MPRAKTSTKKTTAKKKEQPKVTSSDLATYTDSFLSIYKTQCKEAIMALGNLERDSLVEIARILDVQETIVKSKAINVIPSLLK